MERISKCRLQGEKLELLAHFCEYDAPEWIDWQGVHDGLVINEAVLTFAEAQRGKAHKSAAVKRLLQEVNVLLLQPQQQQE